MRFKITFELADKVKNGKEDRHSETVDASDQDSALAMARELMYKKRPELLLMDEACHHSERIPYEEK